MGKDEVTEVEGKKKKKEWLRTNFRKLGNWKEQKEDEEPLKETEKEKPKEQRPVWASCKTQMEAVGEQLKANLCPKCCQKDTTFKRAQLSALGSQRARPT